MAAPTPTARVAPTGIKLKDGYSTKITCAGDTNIEFWEKEVTPPTVEGGDEIDQTTMHNVDYETNAPQGLMKFGAGGALVAYDPAVLTSIIAQINVEQVWTWTFPDGTTEAHFAFLQSFERQALVRGQQPEANISIMPTAWDPTNKVEAGPATASVAGT